jgi:GNAT superfamily N-acetyltransferase
MTLPAEALCDAFNAAFANYVVTFPTLDVAAWRATVGRQGCDLTLSLAACEASRVMAFALVTPRGAKITRIATMGARPEARGTGIAGALLDRALSEARARGDTNVRSGSTGRAGFNRCVRSRALRRTVWAGATNR